MWAPDVYEGAPLPVTAYLAVGSKAAAFALALRFFAEGLMPAVDDWKIIVAVLAAVTMLVGNLVAIAQSNIKRLLALLQRGTGRLPSRRHSCPVRRFPSGVQQHHAPLGGLWPPPAWPCS